MGISQAWEITRLAGEWLAIGSMWLLMASFVAALVALGMAAFYSLFIQPAKRVRSRRQFYRD